MLLIVDFKDNICNPEHEGKDLFIVEWTGDNEMGLRPLLFRSVEGTDLDDEIQKYLREEFDGYGDDEIDEQLENYNYHFVGNINQ